MNYEQMLFEKYGKVLLETEVVSKIIGRSIASLEADRRNKTGIPYKKLSDADNAPVRYSLHEISKWLNESVKVS